MVLSPAGRAKGMDGVPSDMTDLEACYFCGAVDDVERRSVLDTGPTVALCADCDERLDRIIEPLRDQPAATDADDDGTTIQVQPEDTETPDDEESAPTGTEDQSVVAGDEAPDDQGVTVDADTEPPDRPEGYGKVLRFLRNRELPIERDTVVELTANAYDLRRDQVDTALDHAIDAGILVETDGEIHRA